MSTDQNKIALTPKQTGQLSPLIEDSYSLMLKQAGAKRIRTGEHNHEETIIAPFSGVTLTKIAPHFSLLSGHTESLYNRAETIEISHDSVYLTFNKEAGRSPENHKINIKKGTPEDVKKLHSLLLEKAL